jgi:DtxR family transcriptional regulator, manganese transport regulator
MPHRINRFSRTRKDHAQELAEDYVELILQVQEEFGIARTADLATRLQVSQPTVTKALLRLEKEGYLKVHPRRFIELTDEGREMAVHCQSRHATVLAFLKSIGVPEGWAVGGGGGRGGENLNHHVSEATVEAMVRHLQASK